MADNPKGDLWKALKHHHTRPWLAVAAEIPATFAAHQAWGASTVAAIGMTLASGALTAGTWWAAEGTRPARRIHATLTMAAAMTYTTTATFTDPLGPAQLSTLALGGSVAAGLWNVRKALRVNPDAKGEAATAGETGLLVKAIGKAKAQLRGTPDVEPNKVVAPYQLTPGEMTASELGQRIDHIAAELGVAPSAIRNRMDGDNASRGELVIVPKDMLTEGATWPGPSNFGGSITDDIVMGIYEDGQPLRFWFPYDHETRRNATHFLAAGMNGSGKSAGISTAMLDVLTRRDAIVWAIDPSKGQQTFGPFLPFLDWVEMTEAGGNEMIDALSQVITARANELGAHGFKNWTTDAFDQLGMPYMVVWIEEAAKFFRNGTEMEGLVMEARSAGISVIISLQRPSATSMPTDVREQLGGVFCFGVKGSTTADMALPDDVRDAGARPEAWENRKPGYVYLVAPGIDEERYAMPARTYAPPSDEEIVALLATAPRPDAGSVTTVAAGEAYAGRAVHTLDDALTADTKPKGKIVMSKDDNAAAERALLERQADREVDALVATDPGDYDPDVDGDQEIPPVDGAVWSFGQPPAAESGAEKTTEQAAAELLAMLAEYRTEGLETLSPKHFQPYGKGSRIGRSRSWVSSQLGDLADEGVHLAETDQPGVYKLLYPQMAGA